MVLPDVCVLLFLSWCWVSLYAFFLLNFQFFDPHECKFTVVAIDDFFCCFMLVVMTYVRLNNQPSYSLFTFLKTFGMIEFKYFQSKKVRYLL